jgi:threonine dehydrogenase-like Zn-dependent dehydrogenase
MRDAVLARVRDGDVVVTMGAGSIGMLAAELSVAAAAAREAAPARS